MANPGMSDCPHCGSNDLDVHDGIANCCGCGKSFEIDLWKACPTCGWRLRTSHTDHSTAGKASRRSCTNDECDYTQVIASVVVCENPTHGHGFTATLRKLERGTIRLVKEEGPAPK